VATVTVGALLLAGCGGDDEADQGAPTTRATSTTEQEASTTTSSEDAISVCQMVNPETISNIVGEQVTPQPTATGGCDYEAEIPDGRSLSISVVGPSGGEGARSAAEQRLGGTAQDLEVGSADAAWIVFGTAQGAPAAEAAAEAKGSLVTVTMGRIDEASDRDVASRVLSHVIDALS
jgi:hypothetical protein